MEHDNPANPPVINTGCWLNLLPEDSATCLAENFQTSLFIFIFMCIEFCVKNTFFKYLKAVLAAFSVQLIF